RTGRRRPRPPSAAERAAMPSHMTPPLHVSSAESRVTPSLFVRCMRALGAVLALLFLGACGGDQPTAVASIIGDRSAPAVTVTKVVPPADSVLAFTVNAK